MRGIAYRRHRREVMKRRAAAVLGRLFPDAEDIENLTGFWAVNSAKCSCHRCKEEKHLGIPSIHELRQRDRDATT